MPVVGCVLAFAALAALMPFLTMWAFNTVVTGIFGGPGPIDYWQGLAVNVLLGIIGGVFHRTGN